MALPRPQVALVSIELALLVRFSSSEGVLWVQGQLTDNSWLLYKDIKLTGGFAYVLDECGNFAKRTNPELVELLDVADLAIHQEHLRGIITAHLNETGSSRAEEILANFDSYVPKFRLIKPKSSAVKSLLGHTSRSSAELRIQAQ